jgi:hypothetical protein
MQFAHPLTTITFRKTEYGITSIKNSFTTILNNNYNLEKEVVIRPNNTINPDPLLQDLSPSFNDSKTGSLICTGTSMTIYLIVAITYTSSPAGSVSAFGSIRLLRIG